MPSSSPTAAPFALGKIGQIALRVRDLDRMVAFHRDVLGLKHLFSAPPGLAFFAAGSVRLMLNLAEESAEGVSGNSVLYYQVADIHAAHAALASRGAKMEGAPHLIAKLPDHDLWMAFLRDPENNLIGVMSEVRPPAA